MKALETDLLSLGINDLKNIKRNLPVEMLVEEIVKNGEGVIGKNGAAMVDTGTYTGRSPNDKYFVNEPSSNKKLWWGPVNTKVDEEIFNELYDKVIKYYNKFDDYLFLYISL